MNAEGKKKGALEEVRPGVAGGAGDEIRTRDPLLGKEVLYH